MATIAEKLVAVADNQQKVFDAGAKAEYDRFWDELQQNGERTNYRYCFVGRRWNKETFRPKYSMQPKNAFYMFPYWGTNQSDREPIDLVEHLEELGITLDFSKATYLRCLFASNYLITRVGVIDTRSCNDIYGLFANNNALVTVDELILCDDGSQRIRTGEHGAFYRSNTLQNIKVTGVIGGDIELDTCNALTLDSLKSIINALMDYSTDTSGTVHTITLGETNLAKLGTDEIALIEQKGWVIA